jgi:hypothetical protein
VRRPGPRDFPSRRDLWLVLLVGVAEIGALIAVSIAAARSGGRALWLGLPLVALGGGLVLWIFLDTGYSVEADRLRVRSGPFRWSVPLSRIDEVRPSRNPLSSPALSLDRLALRGGGRLIALVSPEDRQGFLRALTEHDPGLRLEQDTVRRVAVPEGKDGRSGEGRWR